MVWPKIDANSTLYNGAISADGNSLEIDFGVAGGCPDGEAFLSLSGLATGESILFKAQEWNGSAWVDTILQTPAITVNGDYAIPVNNRVVKGSKFKLNHDVTGTCVVYGHFQVGIKP